MLGSADREPLQPQDLVLTIVGTHLREAGQRAWAGGMVRILEDLDFTTGAARAALGRLANRELLTRVREGRQVFYSLTPRAEELLAEGDRRIFGFGRGAREPAVRADDDELWTVIWHSIPEDQRVNRARFASRLRFLGFGALQDGTWVAARNHELEVQRLVSQLALGAHVSVIVGRMSLDSPPQALIGQAWRLEDVGDRYARFLADFAALRDPGARERLSAAAAFSARTLLLHRFRAFPSIDPELPASIDPLGELRAQAVACFDELFAALRQPATEHFWATVGPDTAGAGNQ